MVFKLFHLFSNIYRDEEYGMVVVGLLVLSAALLSVYTTYPHRPDPDVRLCTSAWASDVRLCTAAWASEVRLCTAAWTCIYTLCKVCM